MLAILLLFWAGLIAGSRDDAAVLAKLRDVYLARIQPVENKFKYTDLGRGTVSEKEIYAKPIVTILRPGRAANAAYSLLLDDQEHQNSDDRITIIETGDFYEEMEITSNDVESVLPIDADSACNQGFRKTTSSADFLKTATLVDVPFTSTFIQKGYRKSCSDLVTSVFRKTDLFVVVLPWNGMKLPTHLVKLFQKIDPEQSDLVVVITDFEQTVKPDVAEAYKEVLWMIQPFFPKGGAPEVFFVPEQRQQQGGDTFLDIQKEMLHKKLRSLQERRVNLKINRLFRHARQVDEHISVLQRYLEAYVTKNNELINGLTSEPRKFGVFDECDSACQQTKDYRQFFQINPIHEMTSLLDDCKKLSKSTAAVERSLMEELLSITAIDVESNTFPEKRSNDDEEGTEEAEAEAKTKEASFVAENKGYDGSAKTSAKIYRKEQKTESTKDSTENEPEPDENDQKKPTKKKKRKIQQKDERDETPDAPEKSGAEEQPGHSYEESRSAKDLKTGSKPSVSSSGQAKKSAVSDRKEKSDEKPNTGSAAGPPSGQSAGRCKYRKNCVPTEVETDAESVWNSFYVSIIENVPGSIRELADLLPFETEPFIEQAESIASMIPAFGSFKQTTDADTAVSWCKFRKTCRSQLEKTGKVPESFLKKMNEKIVRTSVSAGDESEKPKCNKYRKNCQQVEESAPSKAKEAKKSKPDEKVVKAKEQKMKIQKPEVAQKSDRTKKVTITVDDPKCRFYKSCKEKLGKLELSKPKSAKKMSSEKDKPITKTNRPYSDVRTDNCQFRKSCKSKMPKTEPSKRKETEAKTETKVHRVERPYTGSGPVKCQFSKSCDRSKFRPAEIKQDSKPKPSVKRPYMDDSNSKDCRFRKSCKPTHKPTVAEHRETVPEADDSSKKPQKRTPKDEKKSDAKTTKQKKPVSKPTSASNKKQGFVRACRFRKSCTDAEKEAENKLSAQKKVDHHKPVTRPYTASDSSGRHCRFKKSCTDSEKQESLKASTGAKKVEKVAEVVRPYSKLSTVEHHCRFRKSCEDKTPTDSSKSKSSDKVDSKPLKQSVVVVRPYTSKSDHRDCRFMKNCGSSKIKKVEKAADKKKDQKAESRPNPKPAISSSRPYSKVTKDEKCNFRKSCKHLVVDKIPKQKTDHDSRKAAAPWKRPYSDGSGHCRFRKSCSEEEKQRDRKSISPATSTQPKAHINRPYQQPLKKGEQCRFRRSCKERGGDSIAQKEKVVTAKPVKPVEVSRKDPKPLKRNRSSARRDRKKTSPKPQVKKLKDTEENYNKVVLETPKDHDSGADIPPHVKDSDKKDESQTEKKTAKPENKKAPVAESPKPSSGSKKPEPDSSDEPTNVGAKTIKKKDVKEDSAKKQKIEESTKYRKEQSGKPEKKDIVKKTAEPTKQARKSLRPYIQGSKVHHCRFSKSCTADEKAIKNDAKVNIAPSVTRPYSEGDQEQRKCRFRKSCDREEKKELKAKPAQRKAEVSKKPSKVGRPYLDDRESRHCRFRKSCVEERDSKEVKPEPQETKTKSKHAHAFVEPRNRNCKFRKSCIEQPKKETEVMDNDPDGVSTLVGAKNLALQAMSSFFSPSRRYVGGVDGGDIDVEAVTRRIQASKNRTLAEMLLRQLVGAPDDHEYGCNIFHKRCRTVLGMPPLKAGKNEKVKKKCKRKKRKPQQ